MPSFFIEKKAFRTIFIFIIIILFLAVLGLCFAVRAFSTCRAQASHRPGFFCCRAWSLGHVGFSSFGTWAQLLWLLGSRAQALELWCSGLVAPWHGIFPDQGLNSHLLHYCKQILYH